MSNVQEQVGGTSLETSLGLNFDFDGLLDGLSGVLNKANEIITDLFGEEFVEFFKDVGEDIFDIFNGNETEQYNALVRLNDRFKSLFGDLGKVGLISGKALEKVYINLLTVICLVDSKR
ncbi:MAG: hypothetical protein ACLS48_12010 [[Eubacterium] siraeum]